MAQGTPKQVIEEKEVEPAIIISKEEQPLEGTIEFEKPKETQED